MIIAGVGEGCSNGASLRIACSAVDISNSVYRFSPDRHRDDEVIARLIEAVERYPADGFDKLFNILQL